MHPVALNKMIRNVHQDEKCFPRLLLHLLEHTQYCAWVPELNLCSFSMFTGVSRIPKQPFWQIYFTLTMNQLVILASWRYFSEHVSWEPGCVRRKRMRFSSWVCILALMLTNQLYNSVQVTSLLWATTTTFPFPQYQLLGCGVHLP